jgi:hypothetical protein
MTDTSDDDDAKEHWEKLLGYKVGEWFGLSGSKFKDHLATLGLINIDWNACEDLLRLAASMYLKLPEKYSSIIMRQLNSVSLLDILVEYSESKETNTHFKAALRRLRDFFNRCRENRNDIMHSQATYQFELVLEKPISQKSKTGKIFVADLKTLRRIADDVKRLQRITACLMYALDESCGGGGTEATYWGTEAR